MQIQQNINERLKILKETCLNREQYDKLLDICKELENKIWSCEEEIKKMDDLEDKIFDERMEKQKISYYLANPIATIRENHTIKVNLVTLRKQRDLKYAEKLKYEDELDKATTELSKIPAPLDCFYVNSNGQLMINDKKSEFIFSSPLQEGDELLVHCTNHYPYNKTILCSYDANVPQRTAVKYDGVYKECEVISHRHTVHFTINCAVESHMYGTWNQSKFIIIDPLSLHQNDHICNIDPSDTWIYGSVSLSDKCILMVREDIIDTLPKEAYDDYQVIGYSGEASLCVAKFINSMTGNIKNFNQGYASHSESKECFCEYFLELRDFAINYLRDNSYNGHDPIVLDLDEIEFLRRFSSIRQPLGLIGRPISGLKYFIQDKSLNHDDIEFYVGFGIKPREDGRFEFKTDDEVYDEVCHPEKIDASKIRTYTQLREKHLSSLPNKTTDILIDETTIAKMPLKEVFQFKNHFAAKTFYDKINTMLEDFRSTINYSKKLMIFGLTKDGFKILSYLPIEMLNYETDSLKVIDLVSERYDENYTSAMITVSNPDMTCEESYQELASFLDNFKKVSLGLDQAAINSNKHK